MRIKVEKMNSRGQGIGRIDGLVTFVDGALPGEEVEAEVVVRKRDYAVAKVVSILSPSSERRNPACLHFGSCGGCQLQHASYDCQLSLKAELAADALRRIGGFRSLPIKPCVPSPKSIGYRNKASFPIRRQGKRGTIGLFREGSHRVVPITSCPAVENLIQQVFSHFRSLMSEDLLSAYDEKSRLGLLRHLVVRAGSFTGETLVALVVAEEPDADEKTKLKAIAEATAHVFPSLRGFVLNVNRSEGNFIWGGKSRTLVGKDELTEHLGDFSFIFSAASFFQVNSYQALNLYRFVASELEGTGGGRVLELYSGVGSLTAFLAKEAEEVMAVEEDAEAVRHMRGNMARNGLRNVRTLCGRAEDTVHLWRDWAPQTVVLDPPRSGCHPKVVAGLISARPRKIIYVSCNAATLARDAAVLCEQGYAVTCVQPFDMFPQTAHVECVAVFLRNS